MSGTADAAATANNPQHHPISDTNTRSIPVSLGKPSLRIRLEAYYSLIAPEIISNPAEWRSKFDQIYDKFGGSASGERKLASKLEKKYGSTVRLLLAEDANTITGEARASTHVATTTSTTTTHEDSWYELRPNERGSGIVSFVSNSFDPMAALAAVSNGTVELANPWVATCRLLDNIHYGQTLLPPCDPQRRVWTRKPNVATSSQSHDNKRPKVPSAFEGIAAAACHDKNIGPFTFLYRMMNDRCRVRVLIRYVNCIRGTLTGYLLAFDKHMNMILRDVDEVYTPRFMDDHDDEQGGNALSNMEREVHRRQNAIKGEAITTTGMAIGASTSSWSVRQRHLPQLLVRGDNVVAVYKAESERSAWPRTSKSPSSSIYRNKQTGEPAAMDSNSSQHRVGTPGSLIYALQQRERQRAQHYMRSGVYNVNDNK